MKYKVNIHWKGETYGTPGEYIETVRRVLRAEQIGNFNPIFCRYKNKKYLVHSTKGDLSDPFRRDESYAEYLYIELLRPEA